MTAEERTTHSETMKQDYEPPEVRTEEVFETLALTCTKVQQGCETAPGIPVVES